MGQLNDLQIKAAQPLAKEYLLADGEGLYLRVRPTAKVWVYRYKQLGKEAKLITGSHNFSDSASRKNDENFLVVRKNADLALKYSVAINAVYDHYRWRALLAQGKIKDRASTPSQSGKSASALVTRSARSTTGFVEQPLPESTSGDHS